MSSTKFFDPRDIQVGQESLGAKGRFNPRSVNNPGFASEKMDDLRKGIAKDGLNHALLIRMKGGKPHLIAGERRLRAILGLVEDDEQRLKLIENGDKVERILVKNPLTRKMEPALDVFSKVGVQCNISDATDDKEALRQAIQENTLHESLTDYELLLQCDKMERAGITRTEQADTMGVSEAWISQSHSLLQSHESILRYMERGQLTRTAALTFLNVPEEMIEATLGRAVALTYNEAEQKELQAKEEIEQARLEMQLGENALRVSRFTGNHESARKARRQVARASRAVEKAEKKLSSAQAKKKKKLTVETIQQAAKDVGAAEKLNRPPAMKQVRLIETEIGDLLKSSEEKILQNPANGEEYDRDDIGIVHEVLKWYVNRNAMSHPLDAILKVRGARKKRKKV